MTMQSKKKKKSLSWIYKISASNPWKDMKKIQKSFLFLRLKTAAIHAYNTSGAMWFKVDDVDRPPLSLLLLLWHSRSF